MIAFAHIGGIPVEEFALLAYGGGAATWVGVMLRARARTPPPARPRTEDFCMTTRFRAELLQGSKTATAIEVPPEDRRRGSDGSTERSRC
jgi:hypothetical protein